MEYVCTKSCIWGNRQWAVGEVCRNGELPNHHFKELEPADVKPREKTPGKTLAEAQRDFEGDTKLDDGTGPSNLAEAVDMLR